MRHLSDTWCCVPVKEGEEHLHRRSTNPQAPNTTMAPSNLKLIYFDGKGRAELARMLFNYGGIAFEDSRIGHADFATLKPTLPFGQVPVLEVDGTVYSQSLAINLYAAKLSGLFPSDNLEALKSDMFSQSLTEMEGPFVEFMFKTPDETKKAELKKVFIEETVPKLFTVLEKMVGGKFILGDKISHVDLQLLDVVANKIAWVFPTFSLEAHPALAAVVNNVKADPKVAAYLAKQ
ncbi:hypothetical protein JM18_000871 [Phytophthora kernoviae]|uniref:Glutathione S-transferase n=1 Tax=Phytophthora kernoviae TaxID=325452 RepID=A0A921VGH0_9STRA|nr:hypothetical protein JM18_000871 [Phytophthora kernoviae]